MTFDSDPLDDHNETNPSPEHSALPAQDEVFRSFVVKFITIIVVIIVLVIAHARHVSPTMLAVWPLGAGVILMLIFRALGLWQWK